MKGNKIILNAPEGITFKVREEKDGVIVIEAMYDNLKEVVETFEESVVTKYDYKNPIIPEGFTYVCGEWNNGFTIRNSEDESDFVWIPVGFLEADGTLDGENFDQQFGRRNFRGEEFSFEEYHEEYESEMLESIKKYGGFYISAYVASKENGKMVFKKSDRICMSPEKQYQLKENVSRYYSKNSDIVACLPCGAAYDSIFKCILQTGERTFEEVAENSTTWGDYHCSFTTGNFQIFKTFGIYDLAGGYPEWSTEQHGKSNAVVRGGISHYNNYKRHPAANREFRRSNYPYRYCSHRAMIYVKP